MNKAYSGVLVCLTSIVLLVSGVLFCPSTSSEMHQMRMSRSESSSFLPEVGVPQEDWNFTVNATIDGSPCLAELGGDDGLEVLFGADDGKLYCLNSSGSLKWTYTTGFDIDATPTVGDVDNDGLPEVLIGSGDDKLYCIGTSGDCEWAYTTGDNIHTTPCVMNLDEDPRLEIVVGSDKLYCIDGNGSSEWDFEVPTQFAASAIAVNIDRSGSPEIIVGELEDHIYCLNSHGTEVWYLGIGTGMYPSACSVADIDDKGDLETVMGTGTSAWYCISSNGSVQWEYTSIWTDWCSTPTIVDLDEADGLETIVCNFNTVYCINSTGGLVWDYQTDGAIRSSPCVVDIDGDSELEILAGRGAFGVMGALLCLNSSGSPEWVYDVGTPVYSAVCAADIDEDNTIEAVFGTGGVIRCLSVVGVPSRASAYCWPSIGFMGDIQHTGCFEDTDSDMLTDSYEVTAGSSPTNADTDTDCRSDYQEFLESTNPRLDLVPPSTIHDLEVVSSSYDTVILNWTAPGDNNGSGNASGYILKYSSEGQITLDNWSDAIAYNQGWVPRPGGSIETHEVSGLSASTTYWFALLAVDETPNNGGVSNSPHCTTVYHPLTIPAVVGAVAAVTVTIMAIRTKRR